MTRNGNYFETHLLDQRAENINFLMNECGLSVEATARRLGMEVETLVKWMERHRNG